MRFLRVLALESGLFGLVLLGVLVVSCGPARRPAVAAGGTVASAAGVRVEFPDWLDQWPQLRAGAVAEIVSAGFPQGWTVRVRPPAWEAQPGLLVTGETILEQRVSLVGWRYDPFSPVLLPSCAYEASNARLGRESDPNAPIQQILSGRP